MQDPRIPQAKLSFYTFIFLNTFEIGWFIYGNFVLFYGQGKLINDKDQLMFKLMIGAVVYGYFTMIVYCASCCAICLVLSVLTSWGTFDKDVAGRY